MPCHDQDVNGSLHSTQTIAAPSFKKGDAVTLALGVYQGTSGVFIQALGDPKWAEITEDGGRVRRHPVEWLVHSPA